jgi:hypothetical protein
LGHFGGILKHFEGILSHFGGHFKQIFRVIPDQSQFLSLKTHKKLKNIKKYKKYQKSTFYRKKL